MLGLSIWRDRLAGGLAALGLVLKVGLYGYLAARYPSLPLRMVLAYDQQGLGDRSGARAELFLVPAIGLGVLLVNGILSASLHRRERLLALLLLGHASLVQALTWLAAARLIHGV